MKTTSPIRQRLRHSAALALGLLIAGHMVCASAQDRSEKRQRLEADLKSCASGTSGQALEPCMQEARAVFAQPPGAYPQVSAEQLERNSVMRCEPFTGDDLTACLARLQGGATLSGSVAGGGVLRELVTPVVAPSPEQ
jgi:hypothetical protein